MKAGCSSSLAASEASGTYLYAQFSDVKPPVIIGDENREQQCDHYMPIIHIVNDVEVLYIKGGGNNNNNNNNNDEQEE